MEGKLQALQPIVLIVKKIAYASVVVFGQNIPLGQILIIMIL
jgi:hypothetical protein